MLLVSIVIMLWTVQFPQRELLETPCAHMPCHA